MKTRILIAVLVFVTALLGPPAPIRAQLAPIDFGTVNNVCLDGTDDMTVAAYAYDNSGYLMCVTKDENAEGIAVYKESYPGSRQFSLLSGGGGMFFSADLVGFGVPPSAADALVSSVLQQLGP